VLELAEPLSLVLYLLGKLREEVRSPRVSPIDPVERIFQREATIATATATR
jgi:hypothetical protein